MSVSPWNVLILLPVLSVCLGPPATNPYVSVVKPYPSSCHINGCSVSISDTDLTCSTHYDDSRILTLWHVDCPLFSRRGGLVIQSQVSSLKQSPGATIAPNRGAALINNSRQVLS